MDASARRVTGYEVSGGAWRDITEGVQSLVPGPETVDGRDTVIVPEKRVKGGPRGMRSQLTKLARVARTQVKQATDSLGGSAESARRTVSGATETAATDSAETEAARPSSAETAGAKTEEKASPPVARRKRADAPAAAGRSKAGPARREAAAPERAQADEPRQDTGAAPPDEKSADAG